MRMLIIGGTGIISMGITRTGQYIFCSTVDVYTKPAITDPIIEAAERLPSEKFPYAYYW